MLRVCRVAELRAAGQNTADTAAAHTPRCPAGLWKFPAPRRSDRRPAEGLSFLSGRAYAQDGNPLLNGGLSKGHAHLQRPLGGPTEPPGHLAVLGLLPLRQLGPPTPCFFLVFLQNVSLNPKVPTHRCLPKL